MKIIVAGSRHLDNKETVFSIIDESPFDITELVHGAAKGVDTLAGEWAIENNIALSIFPADWTSHGKAAGPIRNGLMAKYADGLIAIMWEDWKTSRGTKNMIDQALRNNLQVFVVNLSEFNNG